MPYPIQLGPLTDRLRKFFRLRGKTGFMLDEVVVPVALVQDLTKGPYQSGITPCGTGFTFRGGLTGNPALGIVMNEKPGSLQPLLPNFQDKTFSLTWLSIAAVAGNTGDIDLQVFLVPRANLAAQVPSASRRMISIQNNDGTLTVPVELFEFDTGGISTPSASELWRSTLADPTSATSTFDPVLQYEPEPNVTIGTKDAIVLVMLGNSQLINVSLRGFYQQQAP